MDKVHYVTAEEVERLLLGLEESDRDKVLADVLAKLSAESKTKILGLSDTAFTVVTGSFVSLNADIAINYQNGSVASGSPPVDFLEVCKAMLEFKRSQRNK